MRKSSTTANSHHGHNGRQGRARRREACSGSVERSSHSDRILEDAEAQPKATNSNRFAALPPKIPAPDAIQQSNRMPQSDFSFRCDPHPSTTSRTNKISEEDNTALAPPAVIFPCTNQQTDPNPITISPLPHSTSKTPTDASHTSKSLPSPPTTPRPILLHGDLHESPVHQESPSPEPLNDKQRPQPALHPSFNDAEEANSGLGLHKPHRQPTPFPTAQKNGTRGRSRSNSSKDKEGGVKHGGEEQKKEEDKKKGGLVGRIGRGIARMSRKGTERAEVEEGWRGEVSEGDRSHLVDEEEDGEGGWELIGPSG